MRNTILILLFVHLALFGFAQEMTKTVATIETTSTDLVNELPYEVNINYPPLSISKDKLLTAETLMDLNKHFKPAWIREYFAVEILTHSNGEVQKTVGKNENLSPAQKAQMINADVGAEISIMVRYMPENTLKHNDPQEFGFSFMVHPDNEASYNGGTAQMMQFLKTQAIDKIPDGTFQGYAIAIIVFTIDELGQLNDTKLFQTSGDDQIDELLLKTLHNMPDWIPAEYDDGTKVKQEFALTVGNMKSCTINLLNINPN